MKKVLIFYASYGGGHLSAAKSIQRYLDEHYKDVQAEMIDCIKYISSSIEKVTTGAYKEMARKFPRLWGKIYFNAQKRSIGPC